MSDKRTEEAFQVVTRGARPRPTNPTLAMWVDKAVNNRFEHLSEDQSTEEPLKAAVSDGRPYIAGSAKATGEYGPGHPLNKEPRNVQPAAAVFGVQGGHGLPAKELD